jgi:hypothetical protein
VVVARAARRLIQDGHWQRIPTGSDRTRILAVLQARLPAALGLLPPAGLFALGKQPPPGGCAWCCALVQTLPDRPELDCTPVNVALLGQGCERCRRRWRLDARIAAVITETAAAGVLARRSSPPATPALAASAEPPPTSTATARAGRVPHYWQPRPVPWPDEQGDAR